MEAAETVSFDDAALDPGVIEVGLNEQVTPAGGLVQESDMVLLKPPTALELIVKLADCPGETVALWADNAKEKSALVAMAAGRRVAKRPLVWLAPPAVKYKVLGSPVPPAPKTMSHSPALAMTLLLLSRTWPRNFPV